MKILFQLDDLDNIEANLVAEAANRLGVGEFQFFQLAFRAWHGYEIDSESLEPDFWNYLTHDKVPPWVRQYARNIIKTDDEGSLEQGSDDFHRHDRFGPKTNFIWRSRLMALVVIICMVGFFGIVIYNYQEYVPDKYVCNFPPCPDRD